MKRQNKNKKQKPIPKKHICSQNTVEKTKDCATWTQHEQGVYEARIKVNDNVNKHTSLFCLTQFILLFSWEIVQMIDMSKWILLNEYSNKLFYSW